MTLADALLRRRAGRQAARTNGYNVAARADIVLLLARARSTAWCASASRTRSCSSTRVRRRPARCRSCWRAGLLGHPAARGDRPRHGGRLQPQERLHLLRQDRQAGREELREHRRRGHAASTPAARSTSTTRATSVGKTMLVENGILTTYLHDRISAQALRRQADRQRPPRELPLRADAAHALHLHAARAAQEGRDHRVGEEGHLLHALHERPGATSAPATSPSTSRTASSSRTAS